MTSPDQIRDLAAAYVLDALEAHERTAFEHELSQSPELQREVAELREVASLLALGGGSVPRRDDQLKARLMARLKDAQPMPAATGERRWTEPAVWGGWVAAIAAVLLVMVQVNRVGDVRDRLAAIETRADSLAQRLAAREATLDHILQPRTSLIVLSATGGQPPGIQLFWNPETDRLVVHAFNLPPAPTGRVYQLWFLGEEQPVPGGTFNSDPDGHALVTLEGPPPDVNFAAAAVTEEPAGGSPQPTSAVLLVGNVPRGP